MICGSNPLAAKKQAQMAHAIALSTNCGDNRVD